MKIRLQARNTYGRHVDAAKLQTKFVANLVTSLLFHQCTLLTIIDVPELPPMPPTFFFFYQNKLKECISGTNKTNSYVHPSIQRCRRR